MRDGKNEKRPQQGAFFYGANVSPPLSARASLSGSRVSVSSPLPLPASVVPSEPPWSALLDPSSVSGAVPASVVPVPEGFISMTLSWSAVKSVPVVTASVMRATAASLRPSAVAGYVHHAV